MTKDIKEHYGMRCEIDVQACVMYAIAANVTIKSKWTENNDSKTISGMIPCHGKVYPFHANFASGQFSMMGMNHSKMSKMAKMAKMFKVNPFYRPAHNMAHLMCQPEKCKDLLLNVETAKS